MATKPKPGSGNVKIKIDGVEKELVPTADAILAISSSLDGLAGATNKIQKLDVAAMEVVISYGLQLTEVGRENLVQRMYEAGFMSLQSPLLTYLIRLAYGGKDPAKGGDEEENPTQSA